ncbi:hypothetical protein GOP47_0016200 [Adiantum capillus-veneris]|uniref:Vacuolar protein 8 n=1 Tax=Adiantum capillus-veneris TaxID=13818 RepID=A0A9D4ZBU2_ADICA|nr:hypothetical protein GOP47_0016200 [Adiantum capillus-veneris]
MSRALPVSPTDCAAPTLPSAAPPSPSSSPLPPKDVQLGIQQAIQNLQAEDDPSIMKAAASLVMFATLPEAEPHLAACVPCLLVLLNGDHSLPVQRNACAALGAIMNASVMLYHVVAESSGLLKGLLKCLEPGMEDVGLQINVLAALSALAQQELGLALMKDTGVDDILLSLLGPNVDAKLEEDVVDTLCAIAAHEKMQQILVRKGAVTKLKWHLASESPEICVRVLLALGMLCGSSVEGQLELARADGAVKALVKLMTSNDHDVKSIARDLFSALTSNQEARSIVEQMMRSCQV